MLKEKLNIGLKTEIEISEVECLGDYIYIIHLLNPNIDYNKQLPYNREDKKFYFDNKIYPVLFILDKELNVKLYDANVQEVDINYFLDVTGLKNDLGFKQYLYSKCYSFIENFLLKFLVIPKEVNVETISDFVTYVLSVKMLTPYKLIENFIWNVNDKIVININEFEHYMRQVYIGLCIYISNFVVDQFMCFLFGSKNLEQIHSHILDLMQDKKFLIKHFGDMFSYEIKLNDLVLDFSNIEELPESKYKIFYMYMYNKFLNPENVVECFNNPDTVIHNLYVSENIAFRYLKENIHNVYELKDNKK